jgi:hypothetical protein
VYVWISNSKWFLTGSYEFSIHVWTLPGNFPLFESQYYQSDIENGPKWMTLYIYLLVIIRKV